MSFSHIGYNMASSLASAQILAANGNAASPCCDAARTPGSESGTKQPVCSCPYPPSALLSLPRLAESTYSQNAYASQQLMSFAADPTYHAALTSANYGLKEVTEAWRGLYHPIACYPYDTAALASYSYGSYAGVDLSGARRKNATRESTSTLKAWLQEHIKNPYPTKGEKIMLAIITKMTLTQVSTWFANARRRLKKENKMTWSPRNRCEDDEDDDDMDNEEMNTEESTVSQRHELLLQGNPAMPTSVPQALERLHPPTIVAVPTQISTTKTETTPAKPRIWSLAHTATSSSPPPIRIHDPRLFHIAPPKDGERLPVSLDTPYSPWSFKFSGAFKPVQVRENFTNVIRDSTKHLKDDKKTEAKETSDEDSSNKPEDMRLESKQILERKSQKSEKNGFKI